MAPPDKKKRRAEREELASLAATMSLDFLDQLVDFVFAENMILTRRSFKQLTTLLDNFDMEDFENNIDRQARFYVVRKIAEKRSSTNIAPHYDTLAALVTTGGTLQSEIETILRGVRGNLSNDFIVEIDNLVAQRAKYASILRQVQPMQDILLRISNGDYTDLDEFMEEDVEPAFGGMWKALRGIRGISRDAAQDFDFSRDSFSEMLFKTHQNKNSSYSRLRCGIQALNEMVNGYFEGGRVYNFLGLTGKGKSKILLSLILQFWKHNADMQTMDPSLKPAFLYLTAENDIYETTERVSAILLDMDAFDQESFEEDTDFFRDLTADDLQELLVDNGIVNDERCQLFFKYRKNMSVSMLDVEAMVEDARIAGYEIRGVAIDYTKRVRSIEVMKEENERLGAVTNDMSSFAKQFNMPVLTAGQLNRAAMKQLEEMVAKGVVNIGQKLQGSDIGGSWAIIENSDVVIIINPEETLEVDGTVKEWMTFNRIKSRGRGSKMSYFAHPLHPLNGMQLMEDVHLRKSISLEQLQNSRWDEDEDDGGTTGGSANFRGRSNVRGSSVPMGQPARRRKIEYQPGDTETESPSVAPGVDAQNAAEL